MLSRLGSIMICALAVATIEGACTGQPEEAEEAARASGRLGSIAVGALAVATTEAAGTGQPEDSEADIQLSLPVLVGSSTKVRGEDEGSVTWLESIAELPSESLSSNISLR